MYALMVGETSTDWFGELKTILTLRSEEEARPELKELKYVGNLTKWQII